MKTRIKEFLHNAVGHPLMALCHLFGFIELGNRVHNEWFNYPNH